MNQVFTFTNFDGHYPVGTAAVVVAKNKSEAIMLMDEQLSESGLPALDEQEDVKISLVDLDVFQAIILRDGNY
jgi:hypothetical protein